MPALFISDLKPWVKEIFRNRERVTESSICYTNIPRIGYKTI